MRSGAVPADDDAAADASARRPAESYRFSVEAAADAGSLPRLIGYVAQRSLTPASVEARRVGDGIAVTIVQPGLTEPAAQIIAEKMRSACLVRRVRLTCA